MQTPNLLAMGYKDILKEVIEQSYNLLLGQISNGRIQIENEASFQLQFSYILKVIGELHQLSSDDLFTIKLETPYSSQTNLAKSSSNKAKIDITLSLENRVNPNSRVSCAIELKYFKKANQNEPGNRYDTFKDLSNLENYIDSSEYDFGAFVVGTDHTHYVSQTAYNRDTQDFDIRDGHKYIANTVLKYTTPMKPRPDIQLKGNYSFNWDQLKNSVYFLKVFID